LLSELCFVAIFKNFDESNLIQSLHLLGAYLFV